MRMQKMHFPATRVDIARAIYPDATVALFRVCYPVINLKMAHLTMRFFPILAKLELP